MGLLVPFSCYVVKILKENKLLLSAPYSWHVSLQIILHELQFSAKSKFECAIKNLHSVSDTLLNAFICLITCLIDISPTLNKFTLY